MFGSASRLIGGIIYPHEYNDRRTRRGGDVIRIQCDGSYEYYHCCSSVTELGEDDIALREQLRAVNW